MDEALHEVIFWNESHYELSYEFTYDSSILEVKIYHKLNDTTYRVAMSRSGIIHFNKSEELNKFLELQLRHIGVTVKCSS